MPQVRVAKFIPLSYAANTQTFKNALQKTPQVDHSCVLKFYEYFIEDNHIILIYECCQGTSLEALLKSKKNKKTMSINEIFSISRQLLSFCCQLQEYSYIHQGLNPAQIIFRFKENINKNYQNLIKIPMLSIEKLVMSEEQKQFFNLKYASPEQILGQPLTNKSDVYSVGVILLEILMKQYPFPCKTQEEFVQFYTAGYDFQQVIGKKLISLEISEQFIDLLQNMLELQVEERFSAAQAQEQNLLLRTEDQHLQLKEVNNLMNNIKLFNKMNEFKRLILNYMANTYATAERKAEFEIIFNKIDIDLSGTVTCEEVTNVFKKSCRGRTYSDQVIERSVKEFFLNADKTGDSTLSFSGIIINLELFTTAICSEMQYDDSIIEQAFKFFDRNGSGTIDIQEFSKHLECTQNTKKALELVLKKADSNNNGQIDFNEFKYAIKS